MLILCMIPCAVSAAQADADTAGKTDAYTAGKNVSDRAADSAHKVRKARSLGEYIEMTQPDMDDTGSKYGLKRILVSSELQDPEEILGARSAVVYDGSTLLTFDSKSSTREGYQELVKTYGEEDVFLDKPMTVDSASSEGDGQQESSPHGWGTLAMYLDHEKEEFADCSQKITIAVLDSGINPDHEIFSGTAISEASANMIETGATYEDDHGHGTMVSGIIAESTTPNVELMILKTMNNKGKASTLNVLNAMDYAAEHGADIINVSMGAYYNSSDSAKIEEYLSQIAGKGVLICTCSGNGSNGIGLGITDPDKGSYYPAASAYTVAVGSIDASGQKAEFSNYGPELDFTAPGAGLELADYTTVNGYLSGKNGTSFACPYICACAAFLKMGSADNTSDTVRAQLAQISDDLGDAGRDDLYGYGMPDFANGSAISPVELTQMPIVTVNTKKFAYDGEVKRPSVTVTCDGRALVSYSLTYPNESPKIGSHTVEVTLQGNYARPITITGNFTIVPKTVKIKKVKLNRSGKKIKLKWTKSQGTYQVKISKNKKFKNAKTYKVSKQHKVITGLKAGKTYYVKVRAIKKVKGKSYKAFWSDTYKVVNIVP